MKLIILGVWAFVIAGKAQHIDDHSKIYFENELPVSSVVTDRREYISRGIRKLCVEMDAVISSNKPLENNLFSPVPIASALAVLLLGARGKTATELSNFLGFTAGVDLTHRSNIVHEEFGDLLSSLISDPAFSDTEISAAAAIFPNKNYAIKHGFVQAVENIYHSDVISLDYSHHNEDAVKIINNWVSNQTHHRITSLLEDVPPPDTALIITSALYFNSNWETPFLTGMTKVRPFYVSGHTGNSAKEEIIEVPMMVNAAEVEYLDDRVRRYQMIGIPYKGKEVYMYIVVPENDLRSFMKNITDSELHSMMNSTKKTQVIYMMPRMKLENNINLGPVLQQLGVTTLFNVNSADLRNIAEGVYVNKVIHKVELEVTETGTTGSAATGVTLTRDGFTPVVRVEKPFLFFIHHVKTDMILFWGTVVKPMPYTLHKYQ